MIIGFADRLLGLYPQHGLPARASSAQFGLLYAFLLNKWYFDEIYDVVFVRPAMWLGRFFWKSGDEGTIDRFGPDGVAAAVVARHRLTARGSSPAISTPMRW